MNQARRIKAFAITFLTELNFYTKNSMDLYEIRNGQIATRLYIFILISALTILSVYTLSDEQIHQMNIVAPSLQNYMDISAKIGKDNIVCPCDEVSISYSSFMNTKLIFHPICSSQFIEQSWFEFLKSFENNYNRAAEFSVNAFYQFQFVAHLCELARTTFSDALEQFYQTKWVTSKMLSKSVVEPAALELIRTQLSTTINTFRRATDLALLVPKYQSISSFLSTFQLDRYIDLNGLEFPSQNMDISSYCMCQYSFNCKIYVRVSIPSDSIYYDIDGFVVKNLLTGCSFLKTFMASSIDCFFNQTCLDILQSFANYTGRFRALTLNTTYAPSSTFQTIVDQMFIDTWYQEFDYSGFYNACHPASCSYTVIERKSVAQLFVVIIGTFGGLNTGLNLVIPHLVRFLRNKRRKRQTLTVRS